MKTPSKEVADAGGGDGAEDGNGLREQKGQNRIRTDWNFTSETLTLNKNGLKT